ncbi:response regulator [Ferrovibrio terrae]|uniref:Response regulator n=1 Tax=Ferrovibrio terrae TaxID=2594003 RepID=A0A516H6V5_9PROT|nr:response regulator [Ferrovibrio terrae]QDO99440.1 response regulator [Ferrovibrio terrae]
MNADLGWHPYIRVDQFPVCRACSGIEGRRTRVTAIPHISVVDDDESLRHALAALVRSMGFQTTAFASAEDFLAAPELQSTNCLVTDIQMPGMSGIDLRRKLTERGIELPVIMITARTESGLQEKALASGAMFVLRKPFEADVLANCIEQALA